MKKIASFISFVCILNLLAIGGLAGYLFATGRLDKSKAQTISDMLKQQGTPVGFREKVYDLMVPVATTSPATSPALPPIVAQEDALGPATAAERIDYTRRVLEEQRLRLESEAQAVRHAQEVLAQNLAKLDADRKTLAGEQQVFDQKVAAASSHKDDAGFEKTMALVQELKPKQIKDLIAAMPQDEAVRYLAAMEPDQAAKVLAEFKSLDDKPKLSSLLELMRTGKPSSSADSSDAPAIGTSAASGSPAGGPLSAATPAPSGKAGQ